MKLKFAIHYNTSWGQSIHLSLSIHRSDGHKRHTIYLMNTADGVLWSFETHILLGKKNDITSLSYFYEVRDSDDNVLRREWNMIPRLYAVDVTHDYVFDDIWRDMPLQYLYYTDVYATTAHRTRFEEVQPINLPLFRRTVMFRVSAPQLQKGEVIGLCGNHPTIGNWNPVQYLRMTLIGESDWMLTANVYGINNLLEYKYVVVDDDTNELKDWEEGDNRIVDLKNQSDGQVLVEYGETLRLKEKPWKCAGVSVPVFALKSEHSYGVGDFGDLIRLTDWLKVTGMKVFQILPVNDTTSTHSWTDSIPYNCISAFALHPHYMDLEQLGELHDATKRSAYHRQRRELNALHYSDYMAVDKVKTAYIHDIYAQEGQKILASDEYIEFYVSNRDWLLPYAAFCILRDRYSTSRYTDWNDYSVYNKASIEDFCKNEEQTWEIFYVQFNLYKQLKRAADYARSKGISLKGDLPIGIYKDSVETWMHPEYFNMQSQIGAPPDVNSTNGQNWGFPTYNWIAFENNDYYWWHRRFKYMEQFFDIIRIDHILGYFRVWEIPSHALFGSMGHFSPSLPYTIDEIESFGLTFRHKLYTSPFISDNVLTDIFGIHAQYVRDNYLCCNAYDLYALKPEFDTQVKVSKAFAGRNDENSIWIRDGLFQLISNVLFVEDPYRKNMYHPTFDSSCKSVFIVLNSEEKISYMRLYNNYFYERHNEYWATQAEMRLSVMLSNTRMQVCAEDLGLLPNCVRRVLETLRILSLEIQTMPKIKGNEFAHIDANPYCSVCTTSTHDMPPLRLWWESDEKRTNDYYHVMLQKVGNTPRHLPAYIAEEIINRHLYCSSMMCILPIQDWLAMDNNLRCGNIHDERINIPYDIYHRWQYRMNITIEKLIEAEQYNRKINTMIKRSMR